MVLQVAPSDSLADVLDRVLDKSIVIDAWVRITLHGNTCAIDAERVANFIVSSAEIYDGYGKEGHKKDLLGHLFPYWRKDLWTK